MAEAVLLFADFASNFNLLGDSDWGAPDRSIAVKFVIFKFDVLNIN